jgi:hypothetical protein
MDVVSRRRRLGLAVLLAVALWGAVWAQAGESTGARNRGTPAWRTHEVTFRVRDQLSAQTHAVLFPRHDVAFSLTHRLAAHVPGTGGEAAGQELAWLRVSQRLDVSGQQPPVFSRLTPGPLGGDLLLEGRVAPVSSLHLSTTAAYNPAAAQWTWSTAELALQPHSFWTLSLASDAMRDHALDAALARYTVSTGYRTSFGHMRLQLAQTPEEMRIGVLFDVATFLRRTLGF